ncbi:MAG: lipase secretion chaperone [Candidatus Thiodiazotropha sp.]
MNLLKPSSLASVLFVAIIFGALLYWYSSRPAQLFLKKEAYEAGRTDQQAIATEQPSFNDVGLSRRYIEQAELNMDGKSGSFQSLGNQSLNSNFFDKAKVIEIISQINLDDDGNLVIDLAAKKILQNAFIALTRLNDEQAVIELQKLIRLELPGVAGEQASNLLANYYEYRLAENEIINQNKSLIDSDSALDFEDLVQMRRAYLGQKMADKLFAEEEIVTRHMLELVELARDTGLSEEEKLQRQRILEREIQRQIATIKEFDPVTINRDGLNNQTISVNALNEPPMDKMVNGSEWKQRFQGYWRQRQYIITAGLSEEDKLEQIRQLRRVYFSEEEMERLEATELESVINE